MWKTVISISAFSTFLSVLAKTHETSFSSFHVTFGPNYQGVFLWEIFSLPQSETLVSKCSVFKAWLQPLWSQENIDLMLMWFFMQLQWVTNVFKTFVLLLTVAESLCLSLLSDLLLCVFDSSYEWGVCVCVCVCTRSAGSCSPGWFVSEIRVGVVRVYLNCRRGGAWLPQFFNTFTHFSKSLW